MINAVVVAVEDIAVPIAEDGLDAEAADEDIHVEEFLESFEAFDGIGFASGGGDGFEVGPVFDVSFGADEFDVLVDIFEETAVVEIAVGGFEVEVKVIGIVAFLDAVEAFGLAVEGDDGVGDARGGDAGGAEHFVADEEGEVAAVLGGVTEMPFVHAVERLFPVELVHVQGEA